MITEQHLQPRDRGIEATTMESPAAAKTDVAPISLDERLREFEASLISWALNISRGNKSQAARLLQIKRSTLGDRISRCGLGSKQAAAGDPTV